MPQENLEQLRAAHALEEGKKLRRRDVVRLPAMILNNGLLSAAAFALDDKRVEMRGAMEATIRFLHKRQLTSGTNVLTLVEDLTSNMRDAFAVQRATDESLAYLSYLKRFASKGKDEEDAEERP